MDRVLRLPHLPWPLPLAPTALALALVEESCSALALALALGRAEPSETVPCRPRVAAVAVVI